MRHAILALALLLPAAAAAQPAQRPPARPAPPQAPPLLACPSSVEVEPADRIRTPLGWEVRPERQRHWLRGADLFEGDPADRVQLRPEADPRTRREWWDLGGNAQPYRLVCRYEGLESGIMAPVPAAARRCEVSSFREDSRGMRHGRVVSGPEQVAVVCR
ncbi:STY0301 family protein [Roseomonas rosulenta]|uniref:STY0301 family protein n=1 Tax=Roseomonas rosulenta TaxID=2748667 RepID=UPI0018DF3970|nr:STY0301 family protein [Roseomonas rosulenta]